MTNKFKSTYHVAGAAAANLVITEVMEDNCQLLHVGACGSNAHDATMQIGDGSDADAYLVASDIGDSGVPAEFRRSDFVGGEFPRLLKGGTLEIAIDFDGAAGTAIADLTLTLTFAEG
jgi:hypothetical protein